LKGGGILPFGGDKGYKGFGLSFIVEILSGILTGIGFGNDPEQFVDRHDIEHRHNDGCFFAVFDVEAFRPLEEFKREVTDFVQFVKSSPPIDNYEVMYPGELEWRMEQKRRKEGIYVECETWSKLKAILIEHDLLDMIAGE
jgi:uncharacterized oxidoreductase